MYQGYPARNPPNEHGIGRTLVSMTEAADGVPTRPLVDVGAHVEVRGGFDGSWSTGFAVEAHTDDGRYLIRRRSDGQVLPVDFAPDDVRRERNNMWWI